MLTLLAYATLWFYGVIQPANANFLQALLARAFSITLPIRSFVAMSKKALALLAKGSTTILSKRHCHLRLDSNIRHCVQYIQVQPVVNWSGTFESSRMWPNESQIWPKQFHFTTDWAWIQYYTTSPLFVQLPPQPVADPLIISRKPHDTRPVIIWSRF